MSRPDWKDVEIEPTHRMRVLPDGRRMRESRLTIPREWMEQLWQGYRCASCLEEFVEAYPAECPVCFFPVKREQRHRLEEDFAGEIKEMRREGWLEREEAFLEQKFHTPKPQVSVKRGL